MLRQGQVLENDWLEISSHGTREDLQQYQIVSTALENYFLLYVTKPMIASYAAAHQASLLISD